MQPADGSGAGAGFGEPDGVAMQRQVIWLVHALLPACCMYNPVELRSGQYVQPSGLPYVYVVFETVMSSKLRDTAADSHKTV